MGLTEGTTKDQREDGEILGSFWKDVARIFRSVFLQVCNYDGMSVSSVHRV